jgi:uncharacterized membrane protein YfcA
LSDVTLLATMAIAVFVLGLSKGGFAGIGMVSTPLVAAVSDPMTAIGLMLPIMLVQDVIAVAMYRRAPNLRLLKIMLPGAALGVAIAYLFSSRIPESGIQFLLGAISLAFSVWHFIALSGLNRARTGFARMDRCLGFLAGIASGIASSIAHAGSPPFQIYVLPKRLDKEAYVGTSVVFFAATNIMKVPSFTMLGLFKAELFFTSLKLMPLAVFASWLGVKLVQRMNVRNFNMLINGLLLVLSFVLIGQSFGFSLKVG